MRKVKVTASSMMVRRMLSPSDEDAAVVVPTHPELVNALDGVPCSVIVVIVAGTAETEAAELSEDDDSF